MMAEALKSSPNSFDFVHLSNILDWLSPEEARATLSELEKLSGTRYVSPYYLAPAHAALGEIERAFSRLDEAFAERSNGMTYLTTDPNLDDLRPDPRFAELVRRTGLS